MKKAIILLAGLLAFASAAIGATTRQNRADSLLFVGISPVGIHIPTLATQPVAVGIYLGESWLIGAEYGSANIKIQNKKGEFGPFEFDVPDSEPGEFVDGSYDNLGAFIRWFPGNSFHVTLAAHKREWDINASVTIIDSVLGARTIRSKMNADATVATLGFGNQWIMDFGLVIGLDWLLLSGVVDDSVSSDINLGDLTALTTQADRDAAIADLNELADNLNKVSGLPGLFVLTLGWAF
ncbi:MAG: hypothetical protein IIA40_05055 [SAR324 cluster bacterium]|nr:hypothetical protein [SAR324 cluster bacterium]